MEPKFCELHFNGRSTLHKIGEFYLSDHGRQPHFSQNAFLVHSREKKMENNAVNCFFIYMCPTLFTEKNNEGKLFLFLKSSGLLLAGLPLKQPPGTDLASSCYSIVIHLYFSFKITKTSG